MSLQKLKIAMLGHKRIPSREGGVEIVVCELASRMVSLGHEVTCYNRGGHHVSGAEFDSLQKKEHLGIKLQTVATLDKRGLAAMTASFSAAILAAFGKFDVIHFHAEGPCAMLWLPKLFGKRCIATIHGLDHMRAKWGKFASWYIRFGEKCAARFADEIIVLSKGVQDYFLSTYNRKTIYIPNGVSRPKPRFADMITRRYGLHKDEYILFLGRLVPEKGLVTLLDAYLNSDINKKLVVAGGGSDSGSFADELKEKAHGDERVIFTDFVDGQVLEELYSNAYVYVLPSELEGMPLSLLEAMSYGNCCLTSDISECTDVTRNFGISFEKGNVLALREKLEFLCNSPEIVSEYKEKAADYICSRFSWDDVTEKTLDLYFKD